LGANIIASHQCKKYRNQKNLNAFHFMSTFNLYPIKCLKPAIMWFQTLVFYMKLAIK